MVTRSAVALDCAEGSGTVHLALPDPLPDASSIRIRDSDDNCPTFTSGGVVSGRIEVRPSGKTQWGAIYRTEWDDHDAKVACRQVANELNYELISSNKLSEGETPDGSGEIWWTRLDCNGSEETLESCSHADCTNCSNRRRTIGMNCTFAQHGECETCPAGKFSDTVGPQTCSSCVAGTYSETVGATSASTCQACEAGKYCNTAGASLCNACDAATEVSSADRTYCVLRVRHG